MMVACDKNGEVSIKAQDRISVELPSPEVEVKSINLTETQQNYADSGNKAGFRMMEQLYDGKDMIFSPLSLQFALAMCANGASGETLDQLVSFLGFGDNTEELNAYCRKLMEELPAVDLQSKLMITNALLVRDDMKLLPAFQQTVSENYYAPVENCSFGNPEYVASWVNEWASRNTDGFIDKVLTADDISPFTVALIMNSLYFKAKWAGSDYDPMFWEEATRDEDFTRADGSKKKVPMMRTMEYFPYAEMDGYTIVGLPYRNYKYYMYFVLPDEGKDLGAVLSNLPTLSWKQLISSMKTDAEVYVHIPKFEVEERYTLNDMLKKMGVQKAFVEGEAEFDRMFDVNQDAWDFWISKVIQKAKIAVAEWGTEAAAVTVVVMDGATDAGPGHEPKRINFFCDRPFAFVIGERTSGTILFEGTYTGK